MSSYYRMTKHPVTKKWEYAIWLDDFYGEHQYAVKFPSGGVYNPEKLELETKINMPRLIKKKKITIGWCFGVNPIYQIDFGKFKAHKKNQIKVDPEFWKKYCEVRFEFEKMQQELADKIK